MNGDRGLTTSVKIIKMERIFFNIAKINLGILSAYDI